MSLVSMKFTKMRTGLLSGVAVACLLLSAPTVVQAQTLEEAMIEAYLGNPSLQSRRAQLRATDEGVPQAASGWRPSVNLTADVNGLRSRQSTTGTRTESTRLTSGIELQVTQNVYNGGGTLAAVEGAKADVLTERANLVAVEQSVLLDTLTAYMDVLRNQAIVELNEQNVRRIELQQEATRDRYNAGVATLTDVAQAESRLARSRSDLLTSQGDLEVSRAVFEEVVGMPPSNLSQPELMPEMPAGLDAAKQTAVQRNPEIVAAIFSRRSALHDIDQQFADLLPSVDVIGTAEHNWDKTSRGSQARNYSVTAQLSVPIYQQGLESSQLRESKFTAAQALQEIEVARRSVIQQTLSAWETHQSIIATIIAIREEVRSAEVALDGVQQEEQVGQRTVLDVLDAEQELLDARVKLVQAQRDETVARFELISAIGALTARDLGLDVAFYDPGINYEQVDDLWWGLGGPVETDAEDARAKAIEP